MTAASHAAGHGFDSRPEYIFVFVSNLLFSVSVTFVVASEALAVEHIFIFFIVEVLCIRTVVPKGPQRN
jgi:hypothetical protein